MRFSSAFRSFKRRLLFGRFLKNFSWSPLCTFSENAGFGWPCGNWYNSAIRAVLETVFSPKIFFSLWNFSAFYLEDNAICASAFRPFKRGLLFGRFLKNFPWSPLCTYSENAGFGWPYKNCHNLAIWALLEPSFSHQKLFQSLHFKCIQIRG